MQLKVRRFFDNIPPTTHIVVSSQSSAFVNGNLSDSLKDIMPTVCQLGTIQVLKNLNGNKLIKDIFKFELANNKGEIATMIQDSNILKLYEAMRFILGHVQLNHKMEVLTAIKQVLVDYGSNRQVTLADSFQDLQCLQLLTYSPQSVPNVTVYYTNDPEWYHNFGAVGRNMYAHQQWTRFTDRAMLWCQCFHWNMDLTGMADYGERTGVYQGKVLSWNGVVPEHVFETYSTEAPFAKFICQRSTFIAQTLGEDLSFVPSSYCIL